jgi:hypothetical protein
VGYWLGGGARPVLTHATSRFISARMVGSDGLGLLGRAQTGAPGQGLSPSSEMPPV